MDQNSKNNVLINNSRTTWPTEFQWVSLSFLNNVQQDSGLYVIFQKVFDNVDIKQNKNMLIFD